MNNKKVFSIALTLFAAMSMQAGTYVFKIAHPEENVKLKMNGALLMRPWMWMW